jgi:citrate lyase subunit beta / citryl-CoA lyase
MSKEYFFRTVLFAPGHNDKIIASAARSDADAVVMDIEDSVMPFSVKEIARANIVKHVNAGTIKNKTLFVRVNDYTTGLLLTDLQAVTLEGVDGFYYPKIKTGNDIIFIDKLLETIEYQKGFEIGKFKIVAIIEEAAAVLNAQEICRASKRVICLAFGSGDFMTSLKGVLDEERFSLNTPRALIAMAARANNVIPLDTPFYNVKDEKGLEYNLEIAKKLGYDGLTILHPLQIEPVHRYFTPSEKEVADAKEILRLNEEAHKNQQGVAIINGVFIGPPMVAEAKNLLKKWEMIQEIERKRNV